MTTPSPNEFRHFAEGRLRTLVMVLQSHGLTSMAVRAKVLPRRLTLLVSLSHGVSLDKVRARSRDIGMALQATSVDVQHEAGHAAITIPLPVEFWRQPDFQRMLGRITMSTSRQYREGAGCLLGLDDSGKVLTVNLDSPETPHLLIAGTTGAGKTNLLRSMLASLVLLNAPGQLQIVLIDVKDYEFATFGSVPHLLFPVVTEPRDWPAAVGQVVMKMRERRKASPEARETRPRFLLVIDEVAAVLDRYHGLEPWLKELASTGRAEGCHTILATQKPSAASLSTLITSNLPARIAGACVNATDSRLITGHAQSGAERLPGKGSFLLVTGGGKARSFTAPLVEECDLENLLTGVQARVTHPELHSKEVTEFIAALTRQQRSGGRPAKPIGPEIVQWLVSELEAGRTPSQRAIQRYIAQAEGIGAELAHRTRAQEALRLAKAQVA